MMVRYDKQLLETENDVLSRMTSVTPPLFDQLQNARRCPSLLMVRTIGLSCFGPYPASLNGNSLGIELKRILKWPPHLSALEPTYHTRELFPRLWHASSVAR